MGEIVLLLFLPAILYWEGLNTSFREIRRNARVIVLLSVPLVIATAVAVSWTARALGMESHAAAVLGAVLSPTDAAAVAGLAKKLPRRSLTVLKAESIINDGTALVLFAVSVHVAIGGAAITPVDLTARFVGSYLGGIAAGLLVGGLATLMRKRIDAPQEEGALSLLTPFAAFLLGPGNRLQRCGRGLGVGLGARLRRAGGDPGSFPPAGLRILGHRDIPAQRLAVGVRRSPDPGRAARYLQRRRRTSPRRLHRPGRHRRRDRVPDRLGRNHDRADVALIDRRAVQRERRVSWRQRFVTAWAGFRGAVSLAAAVAVPTTTLSGAPFPDRSLLIFIVIFVILVTVLVQGSTLPAVVRWAKMPDDVAYVQELELARTRGVQAALDALPTVADEVGIGDDLRRRLQKEYEEKAALVQATEDGSTNSRLVKGKEKVRRVRLGVLEHKRREITALRNQNLIDDIVLRELQNEMDLEEVQLLDAADDD